MVSNILFGRYVTVYYATTECSHNVPLHCTVNTYGETSEQKPQHAAGPATSTPILSNKTLLRAGPMGPHALKRPPLVHKKGRVQQAPLQGAL